MRVARTLVLTSLLVPVIAGAPSQPRPIVIRASTVLDGKGAIRDIAIVVEGTRIARIVRMSLPHLRSAWRDSDARLD